MLRWLVADEFAFVSAAELALKVALAESASAAFLDTINEPPQDEHRHHDEQELRQCNNDEPGYSKQKS